MDPTTGEVREVELFVAVLGASSFTYAEATASQQVPDFLASRSRALAFFGGVPARRDHDGFEAGLERIRHGSLSG